MAGLSVSTSAFTATGAGSAIRMSGPFNFTITGTFVGTIELQRSFDDGSNWVPVNKDSSGTAADYTAPVSLVTFEPEPGVQYRAYCTAYVSGTAAVRISQ